MSPTVLRVERYRFFLFSNQGHEPPHVAASTGFSPPELTRILALVAEHHDMLLEAWYEFFRS
jgi:hypothetical protein